MVLGDNEIEYHNEEDLKDYNCESQVSMNGNEVKEMLLSFWESID